MKIGAKQAKDVVVVKGAARVDERQQEEERVIVPDTTRVHLPDPHVRGEMPAKSSMVQARVAQKQRTPSVEELAARVKDDNFEYDEGVLKLIWFMDELENAPVRRIPPFAEKLVSRMSFAEMERLAAHPQWAESIIEGFTALAKTDRAIERRFITATGRSGTADELVQAARLMLAYQFIATIPKRAHYTADEFKKLASIEQLEVETFPRVFRFDSRSPDDIAGAGGFAPNPSRPRGTLFEHSRPGVGSHGGGFVSLSTAQGNAFNLAIGPVLMGSKPVDDPALLQSLTDATPHLGQLTLLTTWEYEVANVTAVRPSEKSSIAGEAEVVTSSVASEQIVRARRVWIAADVRRDSLGNIDSYKVLGSRIEEWVES